MKVITSGTNQTVKFIKKLKDRKYRDSEEAYIIEGPNLIEDAVKNNEDIMLIGINSLSGRKDEYISSLPGEVIDKVVCFDPGIYKTLADTVNPQNIIGVIKKKKINPAIDDKRTANRFVILDGLQDPGNVGTIIRTAEAAGFSAVISIKSTADIYSPKVIRAAAGSLFRIPIMEFETRESALEYIKDKDITPYACTGDAQVEYTDVDLRNHIAVVIGNEGNGISHFFIENAVGIRVPMNKETESLNASVAAGIVIYESVRQRKVSP